MKRREGKAVLVIPEKNKIMQRLYYLFIIGIVFSCNPVKKVQSLQTAISKSDTVKTVVVSAIPKVDSAMIVKGIMEKVMKRKIDFQTFNAKMKVDYESASESQTVTAYLSILRDSLIYIKVTVPPYGSVANIFVNKDSVILVQLKGGKSIQYRSINYLQDTTNIPFDFKTIQDVLVGNPVFLDSNIVTYKAAPSQLQVLMLGNVFKHLITLDNTDFKVMHSKLDDVDMMRSRTCDISFGSYDMISGKPFAKYRQISVSEKSKLDIYLDFKEASFNEPLKYTFEIPRNYKRK
jgi:Domain of unknown function (DUF4292)